MATLVRQPHFVTWSWTWMRSWCGPAGARAGSWTVGILTSACRAGCPGLRRLSR